MNENPFKLSGMNWHHLLFPPLSTVPSSVVMVEKAKNYTFQASFQLDILKKQQDEGKDAEPCAINVYSSLVSKVMKK